MSDTGRYLRGTIQVATALFKGGAWIYSQSAAASQARRIAKAAEEASRPPDPMEGFANGRELDAYRYREGAFYLGRIHEDHGENFEAGLHDDRGVFVCAGSGAGKGTSFYIQNCIRWPGPLVCIDPKGEAASITAMRRGRREAAHGTGTSVRQFIGQDVAILDPLGEVRGPARCYRVRYNPLVDIDHGEGRGVRQIRAIASAMVIQEQGEQAHFSESAETLIAGVIDMLLATEPDPKRRTLPEVRSLLLEGYERIKAFLSTKKTDGGLAQEALAIVEDVGTDEWSGYRSTLSRAMRWMAEPDIQDHLRASDFSLRDIVQQGGSVFIVLPSDQIDDFRSWLRIMVRLALAAKMALGTNQHGPKTLFLLDEFAALGHMRILEKAVAEMRGYGIKLVPVIQNIGQMSIYGKNWETFPANSGAVVAWGLNDGETEKYIAERVGRILRQETGFGGNAGMGGMASMSQGDSINTAFQERSIRFPNEIHEQGAAATMRAFVISAAGKPFTVRRMPYHDALDGSALYDSPAHIQDWEMRFR